MGQDIPKQFINVYDKPVLIYTLEGFQKHPQIDAYYLDTSGVKKFVDDAFISDWAKPAVYYLYKMDIVKGVDNLVTFAPRAVTSEQIARNYATATREQAILLALRVFKISDMI